MTCASLTTDTTNSAAIYSIDSTITLHLVVMINLSPTESGFPVLYKDGDISNLNFTMLDNENTVYFLNNAQLTDSGVYQVEHISPHAMLFTNTLFINITNLNPSSTALQTHSTTITSELHNLLVVCKYSCVRNVVAFT